MGVSINRRLDDYVRERAAAAPFNKYRKNHFGLGREGRCLSVWEFNIGKLGHTGSTFTIDAFGAGDLVAITVPPTERGLAPLHPGDQPYGWDGHINEYVAEAAVWWAFDLLSEGEARQFLDEHRPTVIFCYADGGSSRELTTRYDGTCWMALDCQ